MKRFFNKTIILTIILSLISSATLFSYPKNTNAQLATVEVNSAPSLIQQIVQTGSAIASAASEYSLNFKEWVGDGLALLIAKQIIRQMTTSLVTWINSGFEGSPSFMQNPGSFFLDVADQITGDFLAKHGGPLADLCTPFSIDIRLSLAFKYRPNVPKRYACTLSTIIKNSKNAVEGASINGFTAGDFKQGGWPAFVSLTTEPQNNVYGAYLTAESELSIRVANAEIAKKDEISAGRGFLSWRDPKCKADIKLHNAEVEKQHQERIKNEAATGSYDSTVQTINGPTTGIDDYNSVVARQNAGGDTSLNLKSVNDCPVETPGSVIESQLQHSLGGPLRELELADEINEVVNALFAQLVTQVLQKGLGAVSGSGPGDSSSYIGQIQNEAAVAGNTERVEEMKQSLLSGMEPYLQNTYQYKSHKDNSLNAILDAKRSYESVKACYVAKINSNDLTESQKNAAESRIGDIDSLIAVKVASVAAKQLVAVQEADGRVSVLTDIKTAATTAKTINDLNKPSQQYAQLAQEQRLTNLKDVSDALQEYNSVDTQSKQMKEEAAAMYQACEVFPATFRNR